MHSSSFEIAPGVQLGGEKLVLIAGPCVIESRDMVYEIAQQLKEITARLDIPFVFKASFDKANRTSKDSFRSIGFNDALDILSKVRRDLGIPVITDVHESYQAAIVAEHVDILQIPAFLCRQTDLLEACAKTGRPVNIKKGQFMDPDGMRYACVKVKSQGNSKVCITERGSSFGYNNLVVDMRALPIMRQFAPVIFDVTHSVQQPGGQGASTGGRREWAPYLARAAAAVGVDGFFIETHPNPNQALSDGPNMIALDSIEAFLESVLAVWKASRPYIT